MGILKEANDKQQRSVIGTVCCALADEMPVKLSRLKMTCLCDIKEAELTSHYICDKCIYWIAVCHLDLL